VGRDSGRLVHDHEAVDQRTESTRPYTLAFTSSSDPSTVQPAAL
jgi:hypothetical protein